MSYNSERFGLSITTEPTVELWTTAELKTKLRIDIATDDTLIAGWNTAARKYAEAFTGRTFVNTTYSLRLDQFPNSAWRSNCQYPAAISLPRPPLSSVTSIAYLDTAGASQTLTVTTDYVAYSVHEPGIITPAYGTSWPSTYPVPQAVTIAYVGGYGAAATTVPMSIREAVAIMVSEMYQARLNMGALTEIPQAAKDLLWTERIVEFR